MSRLWCFNLDAEGELRNARCGTENLLPSAEVTRARAAAIEALARPVQEGGFLAEGDRVWVEGAARRSGETFDVAAWCPTPRVRSLLDGADWPLPTAPDVGVLIDANARETFADLDPLPGAAVVGTETELDAALAQRPPDRAPGVGRAPAWLIRESLCSAGRGRIVSEMEDAGARRLARACLRGGPLHVMPLVDVVEEFALHGRVPEGGGEVRLGGPVRHWASGGAWRGAERAPDGALSQEERVRLEDAAREVAARLAALGYFGPFGVDAFRWLDGSGATRFQVATDVNARYTMSFSIGAPELV